MTRIRKKQTIVGLVGHFRSKTIAFVARRVAHTQDLIIRTKQVHGLVERPDRLELRTKVIVVELNNESGRGFRVVALVIRRN